MIATEPYDFGQNKEDPVFPQTEAASKKWVQLLSSYFLQKMIFSWYRGKRGILYALSSVILVAIFIFVGYSVFNAARHS